jgi:hypothetical protein
LGAACVRGSVRGRGSRSLMRADAERIRHV